MIDVRYAPGGALDCAFIPEGVHVPGQLNGSPLNCDVSLRQACVTEARPV